MRGYPSIVWVLLAITGLVVALGLIPRVRRQWRWGRTHTSVPMSAFGVVVAVATVGMLTAAAFGVLPFLAIFLAIPLLLVGALYDSWRDGRTKRRNMKR